MKNRRSILIKLISAILVAAMCALIFASPLNYTTKVEAASSDSTVKGYEDRIAQLKAEQKDYEKKAQEAKLNAQNYLLQKEYLDKEITVLNEQIDLANAMIIEYNNAIIAKQGEIDAKEEELDKKFENFKERLRTSYEDGSMGYLTMLFSSSSISDFLTSLERITNMLDYDKRVMKQINDAKDALNVEKEELEALKSNQQTAYDNLKKDEEVLMGKAKEAEDFYNEAKNSESVYSQKMQAALAAEKKAASELDAYLKELANKNNGYYDGGKFSYPLPTAYNVLTSRFGWRKYLIWGQWVTDNHRGIDIYCPTGTPVYAGADGTVEISGWGGSYGNYVVINHGSGYTTLYAHNSYLLVKKGDKVKRGQQIARSGATGNVSGPHLHFEISIKGILQDPLSKTNPLLSHPAWNDQSGMG